MKRILMCLAASLAWAALNGCTTAVPVVEKAPDCGVPADMLALCADPVAVAEGMTFADGIRFWARDRDALRACANRHKALAETYSACARRIKEFNDSVDKSNAAKK